MVSRYPPISDVTMNIRLLKEKAQQEYEDIKYRVETTPVSSIDSVRFEVEESDRTFVDHQMYARIKSIEDDELLTKFAIDKKTGISVEIPTSLLVDAGLVEMMNDFDDTSFNHGVIIRNVGPGDRIIWHGRIFELLTMDKDIRTFFANTEYPFFFSGIAKLWREETGELLEETDANR